MDPAIIKCIVQEVALPETSVAATLSLFEAGATAPFIVRYRKEASAGLDEAGVRAIQERMIHYKELEERRALLIKSLADQGKLTEDLRRQIEDCWERFDIEDLHHRFRPKHRTRASDAIAQGLEPLAEYIWGQDRDAWSLEEHADVFIDQEKGVADRQQALQGSADIIADWIAESFDLRKALREMLWKEGHVVSTVVPAKTDQKTKYNMYYDRREPVFSIPSHRILAIRRGTKEGVLTSSIQCDNSRALELVISYVTKDRESEFAPVLEAAARDSYSRILRPLIETQVRGQLKERADREAIRVFQENLENLLLSPPCGAMPVIGVDAGKGEECRLAAVDESGKFLEETAVFPKPPKSDLEGTRVALLNLIQKYGVRALAIGGGPSAHGVEMLMRQILSEAAIENVIVVSVNDAGVVVYSSSRIGREELPELSPAARAAVSAARRLQDPLAELAKIDPKLIGVGQYQHDVDQKELHRRLVQTVQFCVNRIGADLNSASFSLLRHISGISDRLARRILAYRSTTGPFPTRAALLSVPGMDETAYQQSAGFLRVPSSETVLDRSWIHPECHPIVENMAASLQVSVGDLTGNRELISSLKIEEFATATIGMPTLKLIREELLAPARDPRGTFAPPRFHPEIRKIADLKEGMILEGAVTNVTNFGAFVDVGIHQDGLVHLSQMSNRFIREPREAVKVGDIVQVKVISVDVETKRIGLSMKALLPAAPKRHRKTRRRPGKPGDAAPMAAAATGGSGEPVAGGISPGEPTAEIPPALNTERPRRSNPRMERRREALPLREAPPKREELQENLTVPAVVEPDPQEPRAPEPTLQEKIAILQSKFRGIH
jgi:uncharacterized protein